MRWSMSLLVVYYLSLHFLDGRVSSDVVRRLVLGFWPHFKAEKSFCSLVTDLAVTIANVSHEEVLLMFFLNIRNVPAFSKTRVLLPGLCSLDARNGDKYRSMERQDNHEKQFTMQLHSIETWKRTNEVACQCDRCHQYLVYNVEVLAASL